MAYLITYESKEVIAPGRCLDCPQQFINTNPEPGEPIRGCGLSGELIPDDWDTEERPWNKCPVKKTKTARRRRK